MKNSLAELGIGIATALLSSLLVGGALLMSLAEGRPAAAPPPDVTATDYASTAESTPATPNPSPTLVPTMTCPLQLGWSYYTVQPGDTWEALAARAGVSVDQLRRGNCDFSGSLLNGSILNIPPPPTATLSPSTTNTATATATNTRAPDKESASDTPQPTAPPVSQGCSHTPAGWVIYIVRSGDTLYQIGLRYNLVYTEIMYANCLTSDKIKAGQPLYVPNIPPRFTATSTTRPTNPPPPPPTATQTSPPPPTSTQTPLPPTDTPTSTPVTPTSTESPVPPTETPTAIPAPTETPTLGITP